MIDIVNEIDAIQRETGAGRLEAGPARTVKLRRTYDAQIEDVWDALTNPERIGRWFLPISGDYRVGGRFQFEGNAGGDIVACDRPNSLRVTWGFGEMGDAGASIVDVRLASTGGDSTTFELEHTAIVPDEAWAEYGPGAVGVGWDMGLLGLGLHLTGGSVGDPVAWQMSSEGSDFATRSSEAWGVANRAAGANDAAVAKGIANTIAFYVPSPEATS